MHVIMITMTFTTPAAATALTIAEQSTAQRVMYAELKAFIACCLLIIIVTAYDGGADAMEVLCSVPLETDVHCFGFRV